MASEVSICNLALAHLGDEATVTSINPPEGSSQAEHCERFYPIARDTVLEAHEWGFATRRMALVARTEEPPASWGYIYQRPNNCLRVIAVLQEGAPDDTNGEEFIEETIEDDVRVIYAKVEDAQLRYIRLVEDTTKYSALVVNAIARLLASMLAGPIIKGTEGMKVGASHLKQFYEVDLPMAKKADANARKLNTYRDFTPSGIAARA
jgi:hypothetical protein